MGCAGCSTGRGTNNLPGGCKNNGGCSTGGCNQLNVFDWLSNMQMPTTTEKYDVVEVRFKNDRKAYYRNVNGLNIAIGDVVAVEGSPGHDIGTVSLTGELVKVQVGKKKTKPDDIKKLYRIARQNDVEKWREAMGLEKQTLTQARIYAIELGLEMKICDVEYQGDKTKATFFYTAEGRVDFRQLIKVYAEKFRIRIEMRQIGARQEAAKLGGVGACGRELCCASWLTDFRSVTTSAARYQQLSLNPQKLAGQCGKLKCCLNFELDSYLDAIKEFPSTNIQLRTKEGTFVHFKSDIFKNLMWYSNTTERMQLLAVPIKRVKEVIRMNKNGEEPEFLVQFKEKDTVVKEPTYLNVVGQDDLTRFDHKKSKKKKKKPSKGKRPQAHTQAQGKKEGNGNKGGGNPNRHKGGKQGGPKGKKGNNNRGNKPNQKPSTPQATKK